MKELFHGIVQFQQEGFEEKKELFKGLGRQQNPHTLYIGCSDSRVLPNLITGTDPGDLFVLRNVANIVPPYSETGEFVAATASIEYAVLALGVKSIVVCGHSNCGGCAALTAPPEKLAQLPHVKKWLEVSKDVPGQVDALLKEESPAEREVVTERVNVLMQMENLLTYPYIRERVESGDLEILGWHYIIESGEVYNFNNATKAFELISA